MPKPRVGITLGDAAGIGPELVAKLLSHERETVLKWCHPVVLGDIRSFRQGMEIARAGVDLVLYPSLEQVPFREEEVAFVDLGNLDPTRYRLGEVNAACGKATLEVIRLALDAVLDGVIDALMYAPLNKEAMHLGGNEFDDELCFYADHIRKRTGWEGPFGEINYVDGLWTTRVTSHIALREVSENISLEKIVEAVALAHETLRRAGLETPRIGVAALNPHAGEGGLFGREEIEIIVPAVEKARQQGFNVFGPYPADTIFLKARKEIDAVVSMYHDQGQIAMKLMGFEQGVTINGGLPVVLVTPCHGTAFDIAGRGVANVRATREALVLAARMAAHGTAG